MAAVSVVACCRRRACARESIGRRVEAIESASTQAWDHRSLCQAARRLVYSRRAPSHLHCMQWLLLQSKSDVALGAGLTLQTPRPYLGLRTDARSVLSSLLLGWQQARISHGATA